MVRMKSLAQARLDPPGSVPSEPGAAAFVAEDMVLGGDRLGGDVVLRPFDQQLHLGDMIVMAGRSTQFARATGDPLRSASSPTPASASPAYLA